VAKVLTLFMVLLVLAGGVGGALWIISSHSNLTFDPTPASNEEFRGNIINPFVGSAQTGSPAAGLSDLYTLVASEVCHALGLNGDGSEMFQENALGYLVNTGQGDAAFPGLGTLFRFTSPNVRMLYTSNNGGAAGSDTGDAVHIAEPNPGNIGNVGPDFYYGIQDVNNAAG